MTSLLLTLALSQATSPSLLDAHPKMAAYRAAQQTASRRTLDRIGVQWDAQGSAVFVDGKAGWVRVGLDGSMSPAPQGPPPTTRPRTRNAPRGQSFRSEPSPSGRLRLLSKEGSLYVRDQANQETLLKAGEGRRRIAEVAWVYGEELSQNQAMGWSPDEAHIWFYEFDNNPVRPFAMLDNAGAVVSKPQILDYPKAGDPNPNVSLWVAKPDGSGQVRVLSTREPDDAYIYDIAWRDAHRLVYLVANRLQSTRSLREFDTRTEKSKVLWEEKLARGYIPSIGEAYRFTSKGILLKTERNGFANWVLVPDQGPARVLTQHPFEVGDVLAITDRHLFYTAQTGSHPHATQSYSVDWEGKRATRWTDPNQHSRLVVSPNGEHAIQLTQSHENPLAIQLVKLGTAPAKVIQKIPFEDPLRPRVRQVSFPSADGKFTLWLNLHLPTDYTPGRRYPLILSVYNGPETNAFNLIPTRTDPMTALGVMVAEVETRGGLGRGAEFRNSLYEKLGVAEIDDLHQAVKTLVDQGLVDPKRVGIEGTSYGGYAVLMAMLRYPEAFQVGVASSAVTDWRHYDTIYTERYMGLPQNNAAAYDAGSAIRLAPNLKGNLLLFFGMADDNVHANQSLALLEAFRRQNIYPDVVIGPREGHNFVGQRAMLAYFIEKLNL